MRIVQATQDHHFPLWGCRHALSLLAVPRLPRLRHLLLGHGDRIADRGRARTAGARALSWSSYLTYWARTLPRRERSPS